MATDEHVPILSDKLRGGVEPWNGWRAENRWIDPQLFRCQLPGKDLRRIDLRRAYLYGANLHGADLRNARLSGAHLREADLRGADLRGAFLYGAALHKTKLQGAHLDGARVHGISVWDIETDEQTTQTDLVITPDGEPGVTVDDLEIAQFMYVMLDNKKLRQVIDTITSKVVLILGRFTEERKQVLDALRNELRTRNLTPVLFDFDVPADLDITETVTLLARMARFIVADLTDPASIPMELQAIAPDVAVPIRSIVHQGQEPFSMFATLKKYHWVLPPYEYGTLDELLRDLDEQVIAPSEAKRVELTGG